jgi:hypothetical protein
MLNAEKNKEKILDLTEGGYYFAVRKDRQNIARSCDGLKCEDCIFDEEEDCGCSFSRMKWMLSEYREPVKISKLEYGILEYLFENKQYKFIVRERNDCLYIYKSNPKKEVDCWQSLSMSCGLNPFNGLFKFVTWEDSTPTSIEEVLENCEVIEDA